MIRVLVVDDSAFMRKLLTDFIEEQPDMTVAATARNGRDALLKLEIITVDVITLDVEMPKLNGIETLQAIMNTFRIPVVMVSSLTSEGARHTLRALEIGAVDVIAKPSGSFSPDLYKIKKELTAKLRAASGANLSSANIIHRQNIEPIVFEEVVLPANRIIAIGTSTGGPKALQHILPLLDTHVDAPIVIVQHMPSTFTRSLAERLNQLSSIIVKEASDAEIIQKGTAYIAPGGKHLRIINMGSALVTKVTEDMPVNGHRPSVDVLFSSLSSLKNWGVVAVVLTGMGSDGKEGLIRIKAERTSISISESRETAVVYGMPKAAREEAGADISLRLHEIAPFINHYFKKD
ncbi:chemotaxis response regulator protein-glutamate methylesterase [Alteribacillus sp. HJP-4]|uniref:protein-glutamate methylesterase/protein-glutamine glutaminase n=1 Tax=Alteribacillus sp. HJP-4 TaxID=2775394 RepID=UPI0035CD101A